MTDPPEEYLELVYLDHRGLVVREGDQRKVESVEVRRIYRGRINGSMTFTNKELKHIYESHQARQTTEEKETEEITTSGREE